MGEIINTNTAIETQPGGDTGALLDITQSLLADARTALNSSGVLSVPIAELSTLGAGVSSLIPALNTVTQTTSIAADGLYTIANAGVGDVLKAAKNGNFWASLKTADGASKMVQLQEAGAITATTQTAAAFNPATMMMAVALFSIEQELGEIEDMQRQIISFLEIEKESEIEADVESLMSIIKKYKDNWDNERFVSGNHNQVLTYQNRARKNMLGYQKKIAESIGKKPRSPLWRRNSNTIACPFIHSHCHLSWRSCSAAISKNPIFPGFGMNCSRCRTLTAICLRRAHII